MVRAECGHHPELVPLHSVPRPARALLGGTPRQGEGTAGLPRDRRWPQEGSHRGHRLLRARKFLCTRWEPENSYLFGKAIGILGVKIKSEAQQGKATPGMARQGKERQG